MSTAREGARQTALPVRLTCPAFLGRPARARRLASLTGVVRLACLVILIVVALPPAQAAKEQILNEAHLDTLTGTRPVTLPHRLQQDDFAPEGGRVTYRIEFELGDPHAARGIYIQKLSRSGRVVLNGRDLGSCDTRPLEMLRCHHQPLFFLPPQDAWQAGANLLEVEVFATHRQSNGLSAITIGPADALYRETYLPHHVLQVGSIDALSWLTFGLGLLALLIYAQFREERLYLWFGLTCLLGVLSNLNILITSPVIHFDLFDWMIFASRLSFTGLLGITYLVYFGRDRPLYVRALAGHALASPVIAWAFGLDPMLISLLYMPLQVAALVMAAASIRWARQSRKLTDWAMALTLIVMPAAGLLDLVRLRGGGDFTGIYVIVYSSAITMFLIGMGMVAALAIALRTSRNHSSILRVKLDEREAELRQSYRRIVEIEQKRARDDEREQILRDMHDGFLSTLSITRVALASGKASPEQASQHVNDCIDDLRLMLDSAARPTGVLEHLLVDYSHRIERRLRVAGIDSSLELQLDDFPELPSASLLQIMRIVQEASNNAIRHSNAAALRMRARWNAEDGQLQLEIEDDGRGIPPERGLRGRGMRNMHARADALGARLQVETGAWGTRVRMTLAANAHGLIPRTPPAA